MIGAVREYDRRTKSAPSPWAAVVPTFGYVNTLVATLAFADSSSVAGSHQPRRRKTANRRSASSGDYPPVSVVRTPKPMAALQRVRQSTGSQSSTTDAAVPA